MYSFFEPKQAQRSSRLGDVLLASGELQTSELEQALAQQVHQNEPLGKILLENKAVNVWSLETALCSQLRQRYHHRQRLPLGRVLIETAGLRADQLQAALKHQKKSQQKLGQVLLERKWVKHDLLKQSLRLQKRFARRSIVALIGLTALISCKPPTVPLQSSLFADMRIAATRPISMQTLSGEFKTMQLSSGGKVRIYRNGSKILENVPFFKQGADNTCGQAVVAMLTQYWGHPQDYQQLVNQENPFNLATSAVALRDSLRQKGLAAQDFKQGTLENLIAEVNKGRPTPVLLDFGSLQSAHYVVVVGYNLERNSLIVHDSVEAPYLEMSIPRFKQMWENKSVRSVLPVAADNYQRLMFQVFDTPDTPLSNK